jgi:hypothetical protein
MSQFKDNPVAMPTLGEYYKALQGLEDNGDVQEFFDRARDAAKRADESDVMSRQVGGNHYKKAIQPWDIIDEWNLNYWAGNIIKYVLRYPYKNGVEDLEKAKHYLEYLIKKEKDAATATRN